jgi:hypothetical protein
MAPFGSSVRLCWRVTFARQRGQLPSVAFTQAEQPSRSSASIPRASRAHLGVAVGAVGEQLADEATHRVAALPGELMQEALSIRPAL